MCNTPVLVWSRLLPIVEMWEEVRLIQFNPSEDNVRLALSNGKAQDEHGRSEYAQAQLLAVIVLGSFPLRERRVARRDNPPDVSTRKLRAEDLPSCCLSISPVLALRLRS